MKKGNGITTYDTSWTCADHYGIPLGRRPIRGGQWEEGGELSYEKKSYMLHGFGFGWDKELSEDQDEQLMGSITEGTLLLLYHCQCRGWLAIRHEATQLQLSSTLVQG